MYKKFSKMPEKNSIQEQIALYNNLLMEKQ